VPASLRLVLATRNGHKLREFARLLDASSAGLPGIDLEALAEGVVLPPEDGKTFAENALGKARAAAAATGRASMADDSGIAAAALGGAPGVRSARFAGEGASDRENLDKLLREAPEGSALEYVCAIAYVDPAAGLERVFEGRCSGRLTARPRGERGFGYDPAFLPDDGEGALTMAELSDEQKDAISHRGRAARALLAWLADAGARGTGAGARGFTAG
jgi:XTP/dITP diphosphohydrolase